MITCPCCGDYMPSPLLLCDICFKAKTDPTYKIPKLPQRIRPQFVEDAWDKYERECRKKFGD